MDKEQVSIRCDKGFVYEVELRYQPYFGLVFAYYREQIIANVEYWRITQPMSDNDQEWERYEESLLEFSDMAKTDLLPKCKEYFNNHTP